jgi:2-dehydropantoate 2-reductase
MAKKKIAVVCTGAVGGYAGAHMVKAGEDVTFIDFWPEHVDYMKQHGLTITHLKDVEPFTVPVRALHVTEAQQLSKEQPFDIAFICTKSYDTAWAATMFKQYMAHDGYMVSLQNCMNEETIAGVVGWGKTLGSIASSITVGLNAPGQIARAAGKSGTKHTVFRAGEVHGRVTERAKEVCALLANADSAMVTENLWGERWSKLVTNVMGNGLSACTGMITKDMMKNDTIRHFSTRLAKATPWRRRRSTTTASRRPTGRAAASIARRWVRTWSRAAAPRSSSSTALSAARATRSASTRRPTASSPTSSHGSKRAS